MQFNFIPVSGNVYRIEAVDPVDASRGLDARIRPVEASSITKVPLRSEMFRCERDLIILQGGLIVAQTGGSGTLFRLLSGQELASQGSEGMRCYEVETGSTDLLQALTEVLSRVLDHRGRYGLWVDDQRRRRSELEGERKGGWGFSA